MFRNVAEKSVQCFDVGKHRYLFERSGVSLTCAPAIDHTICNAPFFRRDFPATRTFSGTPTHVYVVCHRDRHRQRHSSVEHDSDRLVELRNSDPITVSFSTPAKAEHLSQRQGDILLSCSAFEHRRQFRPRRDRLRVLFSQNFLPHSEGLPMSLFGPCHVATIGK